MNEKIPLLVVIAAITILGSIYLLMGHNSIVFTTMIGILAALGGNQAQDIKKILLRK